MRKHAFAGRNTQQMGLRSQMAGMSESTNFPVSAAHVWEVAQILFLATIVNAILLDMKNNKFWFKIDMKCFY